ncbi:MAG: hypothetical protein QM784_19105 [Polyangiaceae bacterium]
MAPSDDPGPLLTRFVEAGWLAPVYHRVPFGESGTRFDYVKDGGQDVALPLQRWSIEVFWASRCPPSA